MTDTAATITRLADEWHTTACVLCSINCGLEVRLDGPTIKRVRGDKSHPGSEGYTCEKGLRIDHYQNGPHRLTSPLRRRDDGTFEEIEWDTAIAEIAARFQDVIAEHGGDKIMFYGGGGQGNHLGGGYGGATRSALGIQYSSNALAQEKTGEFWVDGQLFGRTNVHTAPDFDNAEVSVFWGKNPWHSHGFPQARRVLKEIANDPDRMMVVVDPRRSETADLADIHLRPAPGGDAHLLAALLKLIVDERFLASDWLADHAVGLDDLLAHIDTVDVTEACAKAGVDEVLVRETARVIGAAGGGVAILEDLGIQMAPHSTMNSYLEKLLVILTGNFGVRGGVNLHTWIASLIGVEGPGEAPTTPVTGHRLVTGLVPCNVIPDEILSEHPDRFRAMLVESGNPVHSLADSPRMRDALAALGLVVVIDVALTETAACADYVLPAASQYEKWECTFFTLEFPDNYFQLRRPLFDPMEGTLPEYEIHARLCRALGAYTDDDLAPLKAAAGEGRSAYSTALFGLVGSRPELGKVIAVLLYETLGPTLATNDGVAAAGTAGLWGLAQSAAATFDASVRRAGIGDPAGGSPPDGTLGDELFDAILANPHGLVFTRDDYDETMRRIVTDDGRVHLAIPELLAEFDRLADEHPTADRDDAFPLVLSAGERRTSTANTIMRDSAWRKKDVHGAMRISPADAATLGLASGDRARVTTKRGAAITFVEVNDTMREGHIALPNGLGLGMNGDPSDAVGVAPNELTSSEDRDWFAGTPHHKHVPARVEAVEA
jgi:anaerobic selenocysteine-containing dehydrogenase